MNFISSHRDLFFIVNESSVLDNDVAEEAKYGEEGDKVNTSNAANDDWDLSTRGE